MQLIRITVVFLAGAISSAPFFAQQSSVALTFDDLPVADMTSQSEARSINISILDSLDRHHAPAVGFVIEHTMQEIGNSQRQEILSDWVRRGFDLGNHTFSHTIFDDLTVEQFEQEIVRGETSLAAALAKAGRTPRYFRFPENHTGDTKEKHDAIAVFLAQRGYKVAVCTIENDDYVFNAAYLKMLLSNDDISAVKLRSSYLAYTETKIDYYSGLHKRIFGREIPNVMLLHVNQLNADVIDKLLELFEQRAYRFVTLDSALSDSAYKTPDKFLSRYATHGPMWGYRWAEELGVRVNGALEPEPSGWVLQYRKERRQD